MSVWIELRCEDSAEDHSGPVRIETDDGNYVSECWSHDKSGCGDIASAKNQKSVIGTYQYVIHEAKKQGWKKINGEWVCPHCVKYGHKKSNKD